MSRNQSFAAIARADAELLILGSMPSQTSLHKQQYYAHQRNVFWPIMYAILAESREYNREDYLQCKTLLVDNKIALWDVLKSCERSGSLDTAIKMDSIKVNDFIDFYNQHGKITKVCFNGAKAENIYMKHIYPDLEPQFKTLHYCRLPSTSPAHAALKLQQKIEVWKQQIITE